MSNIDPDDDQDIPPIGGFHASQDKTYDLLAAACKDRNLKEVQRLALMTLSWFNGTNTPLSMPFGATMRKTYDEIKADIEAAISGKKTSTLKTTTQPFDTCPVCETEFIMAVSECDECNYKLGEVHS